MKTLVGSGPRGIYKSCLVPPLYDAQGITRRNFLMRRCCGPFPLLGLINRLRRARRTFRFGTIYLVRAVQALKP